jgi:hypothetical protein
MIPLVVTPGHSASTNGLNARMADELRVVGDELKRRGWVFWGWRPTDGNGRGEFVAERPYGPIAMSKTAVGLLLAVQRLGEETRHDNGRDANSAGGRRTA